MKDDEDALFLTIWKEYDKLGKGLWVSVHKKGKYNVMIKSHEHRRYFIR